VILTYSVAHPYSYALHSDSQFPCTSTVSVQRAGATEHGTVVVTRVVQVGSIKISTHPYIQFVGRSVTVVVVHELSGGSGRDGRGCRRISPEAVGAGAGEAAIREQVAA